MAAARGAEYAVLNGQDDVRRIVGAMAWTSWEDCLSPFGLQDVVRIAYLEKNGTEPPVKKNKHKTTTLDKFLKQKHDDETRNEDIPQEAKVE